MNANEYSLSLRDADVYPDREATPVTEWKDRRTGKVVLFDENNSVALVGNKVNDLFLLPGGGIEDQETVQEGCLRECEEETGCHIELLDNLGVTEDFRSRESKHCITHGYIGKVLSKGPPRLTAKEIDVGLYIRWVSLGEASMIFTRQEDLLREKKIPFYNTGFNTLRDKFFLEQAKRIVKNS